MDATDDFFLLNTLDSRIADAWTRIDWPELIDLVNAPVSEKLSGSRVVAQNATSGGNKDVLQVFNKNPYTDRTARQIPYKLIDGDVLLNVDEMIYEDQVWLLVKKQFNEYNESSTDIPKFLESYLMSAILSDFYRGDGQTDQATKEDGRAEEFLLRQIDRVEKLQQQNKPTILSYNNQAPNSYIYQ